VVSPRSLQQVSSSMNGGDGDVAMDEQELKAGARMGMAHFS
jgi:hypothetical protein